MKFKKSKYKVHVASVFEQPHLFLEKRYAKKGKVFPRININALKYHLDVGEGTAYTVKYGIGERLKKIEKEKVEIFINESEEEGEITLSLRQGGREASYGPFNARVHADDDFTPLLFDAVRVGLVIPLSIRREINESIYRWIEKETEKVQNEKAPRD